MCSKVAVMKSSKFEVARDGPETVPRCCPGAGATSAARGRLRRSVEQQELWGRFVDSNNGTIPRDVRMFAASSPYFAPARPDCSAPSCIQVYLYTNLDKLHKLHLGAARFYEFNVQAVYNYAATMRRVVSLLNNLLRQSV